MSRVTGPWFTNSTSIMAPKRPSATRPTPRARGPKDLPGPLYTRAVRELFKENRFVERRLVAFGHSVDLGRIRCPVCLVAGRLDHITPPAQLFGARPHLGSEEVLDVLTDGGHIGTFMGLRELTEHWPGILAWLRAAGEEAAPCPSANIC